MDDTATTRRGRPTLATTAAVAHGILGLCCLALAVYLLYLTRAPEILKDKDAPQSVYGLKIGAAFLAGAGLPFIVGGVGLWKGRFWAWVLAVAADAAAALIFILDAIEEHFIAWDDTAVAAVFPVLLVLLLLPPVWRWCRRRKAPLVAGVAG